VVQAFLATRTVEAPADRVWEHLTDWNRAGRWLGVDGVHSDGPTAVGTVLRFSTRGKERRSEVTALDPGRSVTLRSEQGGVVADYTYTVEEAGPITRVTLVADVRTRGAWSLAAPAIRAAIRRTDAGQLDAFDRELAAG
jgi:uncharacterized protein YndB with AHSA1/START domain